MKHTKSVSSPKDVPLWYKIFRVILIGTILLVGSFFALFAFWYWKNTQAEKIIDQKFHQEIAQVPKLKINRFMLWEGDSLVSAEIENKGKVSFWYGKDGAPRIEYLGQYLTSYDCFYVDENGKKLGYAFTTNLVLEKDGKFARWFPFEVKKLSDIVENYDAIVAILATFPKDPETIFLEDNTGKREVVKRSNSDYLLKQQFRGKEAWCDLYR